nr:LysR family transcriptional regulator [Candidatus Pantoea persica]
MIAIGGSIGTGLFVASGATISQAGPGGALLSYALIGLMFLLNTILVKGFCEAEYWFSLIKVTTVIIFIVVGVLMILGILRGGEHAG